MNRGIFSVYDSKTEAYLDPFFAPTVASALRSFTSVVNREGHPFNQHPADYTLFKIGEWDAEHATLTPTDAPIRVVTGHEVYEEPHQNRIHLESEN